MPPSLRRLLPPPSSDDQLTVDVDEAYRADRPSRVGRPWFGLSMITSLDGSVVVDGSSGALGNANDVAVLGALRAIADLLVVGAGTIRDEGYGPPKKTGQRIGVVTNSGELDLDTDLFTSGAGFLIAPRTASIDEDRVDVVRAGGDRLDLADALGRLHEIAPDVGHVQIEGGPALNGAILAIDLFDELDITIAPRLVGGDGPRLTTGAPEQVHGFRLDQLLADDDGFLFGRWLRDRSR